MSEFLSLYVVDLPRFDAFLGESLADILWYYVKHGVEESLFIPCVPIDGSDWSIHSYFAHPGSGVSVLLWDKNLKQLKPTVLTERPSISDPFLSLTARAYFAMEDAGWFKQFLHSLSLCPTIEFVKAVSVEERAWWIASFLDYLKSNPTGNRDALLRSIELLHKRTLAGYDFEKRETDDKYNLTKLEFVVVPATEYDIRMGTWSENDVRFFINFLHALAGKDYTQFKTPPEFADFPTSMADSDWNGWVHDMIAQFLEIEKYNFAQPNLVSFFSIEESQNAA